MNTRNLTTHFRSLALVTLLLATSRGRAQFAIDWFTLDGGGGSSTGGAYSLTGTIGQPDAASSSGGNYEVQGGFWGAFCGAAAETAPALRIQLEGANVVLAWPNPSSGFQLQESSSLTTPDWADVNAVPVLVSSEKQINQPVATGARFYRLRKL